jgi:hypothetical protein
VWSADGRWIVAVEAGAARFRGLMLPRGETIARSRIVRIPLDGGPAPTVTDLPFDEVGGVSMSADGRRVVCTVYSSRSDIWTADHFDTAPVSAVAHR